MPCFFFFIAVKEAEMRKKQIVAIIALVSAIVWYPADSQTTFLDTVCLSESADTLLDIAALIPEADSVADSLGFSLDSMEAEGSCDSITLLYPISLGGGNSYYVPVMTFKKAGSCTLDVSSPMGFDTTINTCILGIIADGDGASRNAAVSGISIQTRHNGDDGLVVQLQTANTTIHTLSCVRADGMILFTTPLQDGRAEVALPHNIAQMPVYLHARNREGDVVLKKTLVTEDFHLK